jgi:hypothetical protein
MRKAYTPKDIMAELEKLDLDYYPKPGYLAFKKSKHGLIELIDLNDAFLTKEELLYLYGISGDILHRSLNKIDWPRKEHSNDVHNWLNKIVGLLDHHRIILASGDEELWVEMNNLQNKRPTGWIMQRFALPEKK